MATCVQRWIHPNSKGKGPEDPAGSRLSDLRDFIPDNMRTIEAVNCGLHFIPGGTVRFADQPARIAAAVPSMLAEALAFAALSPDVDDRVTAYKNCIDRWSEHSVLFDMSLQDEEDIRSKHNLNVGQNYPTNILLHRNPSLMPRVITTWDPKSTIVESSYEGVAVIYKDGNNNNLLRVLVDPRRLETQINFTPLFLLALISVVVVAVLRR